MAEAGNQFFFTLVGQIFTVPCRSQLVAHHVKAFRKCAKHMIPVHFQRDIQLPLGYVLCETLHFAERAEDHNRKLQLHPGK
ncbi:hypothetical protein D3C73_1356440 [compost metagenome]